MTDFNPKTPLVMARRKSVNGHYLNAGRALVITKKPEAAGEVDQDTARLLFDKGIAIPADQVKPTPVETKEQEAARLQREKAREEKRLSQTEAATSDSDGEPSGQGETPPAGDPPMIEPQADLVAWQADDAEAKAKKGDRVTNDHLRLIAGREEVVIETDDNKTDLQQKIMAARAARAAEQGAVVG